MKEHIQWQELHELLKELAQKEYGDKYGEQIFWYFEDVIEDSCKVDSLEEENKRLNSIIKEVREKLLCYGETFDLKVHQEMQKELLEILDKVGDKK